MVSTQTDINIHLSHSGKSDVWVWTLNQGLGNTWHVLSLLRPWWQVICRAFDWWQRPWCPIRGWESAHFLFSHWRSRSEDETKPERCALVWTRLVIYFSLNIRPVNGLLQWSVNVVSFFILYMSRMRLSSSSLQQLNYTLVGTRQFLL